MPSPVIPVIRAFVACSSAANTSKAWLTVRPILRSSLPADRASVSPFSPNVRVHVRLVHTDPFRHKLSAGRDIIVAPALVFFNGPGNIKGHNLPEKQTLATLSAATGDFSVINWRMPLPQIEQGDTSASASGGTVQHRTGRRHEAHRAAPAVQMGPRRWLWGDRYPNDPPPSGMAALSQRHPA